MSHKKPTTPTKPNPMENKKRATEPPPPFAPPGDYERAASSGAITKDERPPPAMPRGGRKLSPQDQHMKDRNEKFKTDRVKKLFANATAPSAQTTSALKPSASESDINAAFDDEDTDESEAMTLAGSSEELGIDVETSITRKHNDDR